MHREPTLKTPAASFQAIQQDGSLQWEVQGANWTYMRTVIDIESKLRKANIELHDLLLEIGQTVADDDSHDPMDITKTRELHDEIQTFDLQIIQIKEQMLAAMRAKLISMMPPGAIEKISDIQLEQFFGKLERATHVQLWLSSALKSGKEKMRQRLKDEEDGDAQERTSQ